MSRVDWEAESTGSRVDRIKLKQSWLVTGIVVLNVFVLLWLWLSLSDSNLAALLTGTLLLANLSGFLAGVAYRLFELRDELMRKAQFAESREELRELRKAAPSEKAVRYRVVFSAVCFVVSAAAVLLANAIQSDQQTSQVMVVSFMILVSAMVCAILATFMKAVD